ncbi:MAG TPA: type VI secretion system contractile sheath large subunit, partial [Labilithrix sp.]|nr:type VI secretion system contractile sheath large subunit [Labilithrix sp.]
MSETNTELNLKSFLSSVRLNPEAPPATPMLQQNLEAVNEEVTPEDRFVSSLAAVAYNMNQDEGRFDKQSIQDLIANIDKLVDAQLNEILHAPEFQRLEAQWTSIADLVKHTNFKANVQISLLDVSKEEAYEDLELNSADIAGSELFKKVYVAEYDQFGGAPFGVMVGNYEFANTPQDMLWLKTIGKIGAAAHAPFVASVSPKFFGCETMTEVNQLRDITGLFNTPRYSAWNALRDTEEAAYVGLTMPRYMARAPYDPMYNPADGVNFSEKVRGDNEADYVWASSAMLFARNLVRSFETSGWCQHLRGVKGGGQLTGLSSHTFNIRGEDELRAPVEISMPDFRELELANSGMI